MQQCTVNSLCKDTPYKDNLDVRTMPLVNNHCILTAVVPLSQDRSMYGRIFLGNQSIHYKQILL